MRKYSILWYRGNQLIGVKRIELPTKEVDNLKKSLEKSIYFLNR